MPRRLRFLPRLLAVAVALLQGAVPAAVSVTEGLAASRGAATPGVVHIEDGRQESCAFVHPAECALCICLTTFPRPEFARGELVVAPRRLVPSGTVPVARVGERRGQPGARAPPAV